MLEHRVKHLEDEVKEMRGDVRALRDDVAEMKGKISMLPGYPGLAVLMTLIGGALLTAARLFPPLP
ncbi:hypothetical protein JMM61_18950 [Rhodovulum sulfidophilum]|uniref:hypothetical protein n=1 Tax=Rhodovulum sulfidophilum TaxID=35806 RepID=UPI001927771A|nr:hypothetical protein [Rhodovulum sulfidophilum]MBL3587427.1 hypothetical protein [Rhodovulum sulfidophilum]